MCTNQSHPSKAVPLLCTMTSYRSCTCLPYVTCTGKALITCTLCAVYVRREIHEGCNCALGANSSCCCCDITGTAAPVSTSMMTGTPLTWMSTWIGVVQLSPNQNRGTACCSSSCSAEVRRCALTDSLPGVLYAPLVALCNRHTLAR